MYFRGTDPSFSVRWVWKRLQESPKDPSRKLFFLLLIASWTWDKWLTEKDHWKGGFYINETLKKNEMKKNFPTSIFCIGLFFPTGKSPDSEGHPAKLFPRMLLLAAKSLQSCPTLCDPIDGSPPVPGILQARTLEWVAISFFNDESEKWKWSRSVMSDY